MTENEKRTEIIKTLQVTAEICGTQYTPEAARIFVRDLSEYPHQQVIGALRRCRREVRGRLTVADVINRLDDGRPGPEEAWALLPVSEDQTVVWSDEMRQAWAVASPLLSAGERVAARMAFKETYVKLVSQAREKAVPVRWEASVGTDPRQRASALQDAVNKGLLNFEVAAGITPELLTKQTDLPALQNKNGDHGVIAANIAKLRDLTRQVFDHSRNRALPSGCEQAGTPKL